MEEDPPHRQRPAWALWADKNREKFYADQERGILPTGHPWKEIWDNKREIAAEALAGLGAPDPNDREHAARRLLQLEYEFTNHLLATAAKSHSDPQVRASAADLLASPDYRRFRGLHGDDRLLFHGTDDDAKYLAWLLQDATDLATISISNRSLTDEGLRHLATIPSLKSVDIYQDLPITDAGLRHILTNARLESLMISRCSGITGAGLRGPAAKTLLHLGISRCPSWDDEGMRNIGQFKSLQSLSLGVLPRITDQSLAVLGNLPALTRLELGGCEQLTDEALRHAAGLPALEFLELTRPFSGVGLRHLANARSLKTIELSYARSFTDEGFKMIGRLSSLREVRVPSHTKLRADSYAVLKDLPHLTTLDLTGSDLDDAAMKHVGDLETVRKLELHIAEFVTDTGLLHLARMPQLTELRLGQCRGLTYEGVKKLEASLRPEIRKYLSLWYYPPSRRRR